MLDANARQWNFIEMPAVSPNLASLGAAIGLMLAAGTAMGTEIMVQGDVCSGAVRHRSDVGVAYQPGVDAYGRKVATADLSGGGDIQIPETIIIDITVELQKRYGLPADSRLFKPEAHIGALEVEQDGTMRFNGVPVSNDEALAVQAACRAALGLPPLTQPKPAR